MLIAVANVLILLRGVIPDIVSIVVANAMAIGGAIAGLVGLQRFTGMRGRHFHNTVLLAAFIAVHTWFSLVRPDLAFRNVNLAATLFIVCIQCAWLLLAGVDETTRVKTRVTGLVYALFCAVNAVRIIEIAVHPFSNENFLSYSGVDSLFVMLNPLLMILLTYSMALMVADYLRADLALEEEKFFKAFHSSPYAVIISNLEDGAIMEANRGFEAISGHAAKEAIGATALGLHLWENEGGRESFVSELAASGRVRDKEMRFRKKNGEMLDALLSADIITINGRRAILSSISDVTEQKRARERIQNLLREKEFLLKEVHHRIKNNMNSIQILLAMKAGTQEDPAAKSALQESAGRVRSMMLLYDRLYRSESVGSISVRDYLPSLVGEIVGNFYSAVPVRIETDFEDIVLEAKMLHPLGIIINEIVTNSMKYGFEGRSEGLVRVTAARRDGRVRLVVADDGAGLPASVELARSPGFGLQLVGMLVEKLDGSVAIERGGGTRFVIEFPA